MKTFAKLLVTAFGSGAFAALLQGMANPAGMMGDPKATAAAVVAGGLIGMANHLRTQPHTTQ